MSAALYFATAIALLFAAHRWMSPIRKFAAAALLLLPLLFTGRALLIDGLYGPFDLPFDVPPLRSMRGQYGVGASQNGMISDLYTQIIPYRKAVHDALARGEWPLWNPYTLGGEPLAAEAQPAAYSPVTLIALLLPVAKSFTFTATLWFFIAAFGAYLFARDLECGELPSLVAAAAFMASSGLVFFIDWPLGQSWVLLPFVFLAVRWLHRSPWFLLIVLTLLILTGHPESVLHVVFLGVAYAIFRLIRGQARRALLHGIVAGVLALGICAIDLLPFLEATKQTDDYTMRRRLYAYAERAVPASQSVALLAADVLADLQQRLSPREGSAQPFSASIGSIGLALALFALWRVRGPEKWFFAGMLAFCLLEHARTPLESVMQRLPLFDIAVNDRFAFGGAFAFSILAAMGLDHLIREGDAARFVRCAFATLIGVTIATIAVERSGMFWPNFELWGEFRFFADVALLSFAILLVIAQPRIAAIALFACLLLQRTMQETGVYPTLPAGVAYPPIPLFKPLENVRDPFRIIGQGVSFLPGTNAFYGLEDARGYSPMNFRRYTATYSLWCQPIPIFVNIVDDLTRPFLSVMNVRYAIAPALAPLPPHWREIARHRGSTLLENEQALPRAFIPSVVHVGSSAPPMEMSLADDLRNHVWIEARNVVYVAANGPGQVTIARRNLGYQMHATMQRAGWVVVSESAWPGWRAYIDGRRVQHQFADVAFIGIYVPAGKHAIQLIYWPESFVEGRAISAITLAGIIVFLVARRLRAIRDRRLQSSRS